MSPNPAESSEPMTQNFRKHPRFRAEGVAARMYLKGILTGIGLGRTNVVKGTLNLSEGGLMISARKKLTAGARVRLSLAIEKFNDTIDCDGEIRWCRQNAYKRDLFYVGIRFDSMGSSDQKKIIGLRDWLNSPEYRARTAARRKDGPPMEISF